MVPKVILQRNTMNSKVVPLVVPSCINWKEYQISNASFLEDNETEDSDPVAEPTKAF